MDGFNLHIIGPVLMVAARSCANRSGRFFIFMILLALTNCCW
nr:MAG TPA: hypothetical protein [Caudoviricetes sp.]